MDRETISVQLDEAATLSLDSIRQTIRAALTQHNAGQPYESSAYVYDVIGDESGGDCIVEMAGQLYRVPYKIEASSKKRSVKVSMSKAQRVFEQRTYVLEDGLAIEADRRKLLKMLPQSPALNGGDPPSEEIEESEVLGDLVPLEIREGAVGLDGSMAIKLIAPGKGSSGFYSEAVLKQAAKDNVFPKGTHMYWNHATESEDRERPEGDLRDLAGVLQSNAYWDSKGQAGPGLYARAKAMESYGKSIDDLAPHIGVSIRAMGQAKPGKDGPVIEKLTKGLSADFVTRAGAGGKILQLFEAARPQSKQQESDMDEAKVQSLITEAIKPLNEKVTSLEAENKSLKEANQRLQEKGGISDAASFVRGMLNDPKVVLHESQKSRLVRDLSVKAPLTESGTLDQEAFKTICESAIKEAVTEFSAITGSGRVSGLGAPVPESEAYTEAEIDELAKYMQGCGLSESAAKIAANGR